MNRRSFTKLVAVPSLALLASAAFAATGPALLVVAHPDDEYYCAATIYRMAVQLGIPVDEAILTNGEGGYRYSTLAEPIYGVPLTHEEVGRRELPAIRKQEALNAGKILGIRQHYFLNQKDEKFTTDIFEALAKLWDTSYVLDALTSSIEREHYQYVFVVLPRQTTHGHHQAATWLAMQAIRRLPVADQPVLIGVDNDGSAFAPVPGLADTTPWDRLPGFVFDRNTRLGFQDALSYQVVVNWMIAEHKSQGLFQTQMGKDQFEYFWIPQQDKPQAGQMAAELFRALLPK